MTPASARSDRILVEKLRLLYRGNFAVPTNFIISCVVAFILWDSFPHAILVGWLAATAAVVSLRILLYRRFLRAIAGSFYSTCWARAFCLGAAASGLLWGTICFGLPVWGHEAQYVVMMLVISGVSAGALTTIVTYLPAFLLYAGSMIIPLAVSLLLYHEHHIAATGWLLFLYFGVLAAAAVNLSRSAIRSIELNIDNEILNQSLQQTRIERDEARIEKWSALAQLSHELRTPLNAILGFSELMREQLFGPLGNDRYRDYAALVHSSGQQLLMLVEKILQLSQGEAGQLRLNESIVDMATVVRGCVDAMAPAAHQAGLTLKTAVFPRLPLLRADESKVRQMLHDIVDNAIKFTPQGEVSLEVSPTAGGGIDVCVRDTGVGMKPEDIPIALQPFGRLTSSTRSKNAGIGLGLPTCKRLAEQHGAEISLSSEPGKGTACKISFPASRCIVETAADAHDAAAA